MNTYPAFETYNQLYAKYMNNRPVGYLLGLAGDIKGKSVLDLCGGGGGLSIAAINRGASKVCMIERCEDMLSKFIHESPIKLILDNVQTGLAKMGREKITFDLVFCRQAVNYWLNEKQAIAVAQVVKPGGMFIFNTLNSKPSENITTSSYEYDGHKFTEISWLVEEPKYDVVHHVQVRKGLPPHVTRFRWIPPQEFDEILSPHFKVECTTEGKTDIYRCVKEG